MTKVQVTNPKGTHIPVMLSEVGRVAEPVLSQSGSRYLDATFGRGGHFQYIWERFGQFLAQAVAMDQDAAAIAFANQSYRDLVANQKVISVHGNFSQFSVDELGYFDFILMDLGVSSPQLDDPSRGFSFYYDGPLDMRMDQTVSTTAADIVNYWGEKELITLFQTFGEIRAPYKVVRAIIHERRKSPFRSTRQLAEIIEKVEGWRQKGRHPATLYFQALRIEVNQELNHLKEGLPKLVAGLKPKGRLAVLTFHSLEDRIVKWMFKQDLATLGKPLFKKVIEPTEQEVVQNPRARSAKLRVFERFS
ncbi:MAG: 16S rRNA (cytosine(1402)-N(4))-methyltransferase RsmH [Bdellovibrionaceae bacterium]|nr:16S rRNA (cytosine(1402)-N(4))-methyltransferase RsmH [Pseudobdellovibrionaceae bacterium]MDW8189853.1 16S rRNA (cytosine(1402)-N(4))-methyltransferase RsmH [Pseudobdellovibrionaceae bacterium]